ncbi:MAG TPA: DNA methylase, partial [Clostridiales bacterium]|nr:DNA methylase [Clostridiales bacterium]
LLIDHAWGWEPTEIKDIRAYKPESNSISSGQVLSAPYPYEKAKLIVKEMTELLTLDLVRKGLVTKQLVLTLVYDVENMFGDRYAGAVVTDKYGRVTPKPAHGTENLPFYTSAGTLILEGITRLFERICNKKLTVRKIYVVAEKVLKETDVPKTEQSAIEQLDMFTDVTKEEKSRLELEKKLEKERARQETVLAIQKKYGKNAVVKGMNLEEGATSISRNGQIGGHKA